MQGLSLANNLLANQVQYNLTKNQGSLEGAVAHLSSGLRINSAADDPSGLAIATNLQTQVYAFQQASSNVQDANNAAQVAEGALQTETAILQRIRSLAVEASSSINSNSDNQNLQAEISQLILEINRISQNTNFNGQALLDGSHAGFQAYTDASYTISSNTVLASGAGMISALVPDGNFASPPQAANSFTFPQVPTGWTRVGTNNTAIYNGNDGVNQPMPAGQQAVYLQSSTGIQQTLTGLTPGGEYSVTLDAADNPAAGIVGALQVLANGVDVTPSNASSINRTSWTTLTTQTFVADASGNVTLTINNSSATGKINIANVYLNTYNPTNTGNLISSVTEITTTTAGFSDSTNAGAGGAGTIFNTTSGGAVDGTIELQVVNVNSTQVGVEVSFFSSAAGGGATQVVYDTQAAANSVVSVDGLNITIGNVTAADAGTTAYIKVSQAVAASSSASGPLTVQSGADQGNTVEIGIQATNAQTLRISNVNVANTNAPVLAAEDAIAQVQNALDTLLAQRAQLGAVIVRLNEDANNDNVAAVNLQASESAIRDLNVGEATTEFTRLQVLVQVGTSILAQSNNNADSVLALFH